MQKILTFLLLLSLTLVPAVAIAGAEVGTVTRLQNKAEVLRDGQLVPLDMGSAIEEDDEILSADDARVEVTFVDGTKLTIGENSRLLIDEFLYDPEQSIGRILLDAIQGPFRFISGGIGTLKDKRAEVRTSSATIGIRGTDFWGGPSQGIYGIFLIDGVIIVRNKAGGRILNTAGTGVNLTGADVPPGDVSVWSKTRVDEAFATVTFR